MKYLDYELLYSEEATPEILISDQLELANFKDACRSVDKNQWMIAMEEEMNSLKTNKTWDLVPLPPNCKALKNRWVYKVKEEDSDKKIYHARLVVKGNAQQKRLDFQEIFSLVVQMTTIRVVLELVAI